MSLTLTIPMQVTGSLRSTGAPTDHYVIDLQKDRVGINRPGAPDRRSLNHAGSLVFFPSGAPWTKLAFERHERLVTGLTLTGIGAPLKAQRS